MKKRLQILVIIILTQLTIGCFGVSNVRYSKPILENDTNPVKFEKYVGDMFVTPDIAFQVYPLNSKNSGMSLFPIPFPYSESRTKHGKFSIGISLKPTVPGISFSPEDVLFWRIVTDQHKPVSIIGPYECASSAPRPPQRSLPVEPILLNENTVTCYWLDISTKPPDPTEIFYVQIRGLSLEGRQYPLPIIKFQEDKRTETFAIP
jgi:hypothetical protein